MSLYTNDLTAGALRAFLRELPADTPVVICHPGEDHWPNVEIAADMNEHAPESLPVVYIMPEPHGGA